MTPKRFRDVERLYSEVLNLSPSDRTSFLQKSCGDDLELRVEIESLLSFENSFDSRIDSSPRSLVAEVFSISKTAEFVGKQINQHKVVSLLGKGGMGAVYLAQDTILGRKVAIKLMATDFVGELNKPGRFFQEAKSASALNHPNILTVYEIGEFEGSNYLVTEFVDGLTLKHYLLAEEHSLKSILEIALQIASALAAAHEAGIIHRDIKPDNIMVRKEGMVKVLDFGLAKLTDSKPSVDIDLEGETVAKNDTKEGMILGTPQYMSPEQARGQKVDSRSDIFSFGIVLYEMLTGHVPFSGVNELDTIGSILKDEPKLLSEHDPAIPPELERLVSKTLRKDREKRYQHIKDLYIDLNDIKKTIEPERKIASKTIAREATNTIRTTSNLANERRFSLIHVVAILLLAVTIGGAVWSFTSGSKRATQTIAELKTSEVVSWSSSSAELYSFGSFSPDSKMVAFSSTKSGGLNIWVKQTNSGDSIQVTKDEFRNEQPIWSPDGEEIAFYSARGGKVGIWRVQAFGGSAKIVGDTVDDSLSLRSWSKSGLIYYEAENDLFTLNALSGETKKVTDLRSQGINASYISVSRNEKQVVYATSEDETYSLWVDDVGGSSASKVAELKSEIRNSVWHSDNERFFFSANVNGTFQIFVGFANGSTPQQISFAERDCFVVDASEDGNKVLYGSAKEESDIWAVNTESEEEVTIAADLDAELWPNVSPDGKSIAYQSIKNLSQGNNLSHGSILAKIISGDDPPQEIVAKGTLPVWSPNSQQIAFFNFSGNIATLQVIGRSGGNQKQLFGTGTTGPSYSVLPYNRIHKNDLAWSPDGSKIAHVISEGSRRVLKLLNTDGSGATNLTEESVANLALYSPIWSTDGKQIAFSSKTVVTNADGIPTYAVFVIDVDSKSLKQVIRQQKFLRLIAWSADGSSLILASVENNPMEGLHPFVSLQKVEISGGKVSEISKLKDSYLYNIHLSPNGKQIAYVSHVEDKDNIFLMAATGGQGKQVTRNSDSRLFFSSLAWSPDNKTIFFGKQSRYSLLTRLSNFN